MVQIPWCVLDNENTALLHFFTFLCAGVKTV